MSLGCQSKLLDEILHGKPYGIVGAFLAAKRLDALPGPSRVLRERRYTSVVSVVEQSGKERRRCGHRAAPLGQRQRRVFVPHQRSKKSMRLAHACLCTLLTHRELHGQRVDEETEPTGRSLTCLHPAETNGAENDVFTLRQTGQNHGPCLMTQAC